MLYMQGTLEPLILFDDVTRTASFRNYDGVYNNLYVAHNKGSGVAQTEIAGKFSMPSNRWIFV